MTEPKIGPHHCPPGFMTRQMIKEHTGLTENQLKRLEGFGRLKAARKNNSGWALYTIKSVENLHDYIIQEQELAKTKSKFVVKPLKQDQNIYLYSKEDAIEVFKLLDSGEIKLIEIVYKLKIHPKVLQTILKDYTDLFGTVFVVGSIIEEMNKLPLDAVLPIKSGEDIFHAFLALQEELNCSRCRKNPKSICNSCAHKFANSKATKSKKPAEIEIPTDLPESEINEA